MRAYELRFTKSAAGALAALERKPSRLERVHRALGLLQANPGIRA